MTTRQIGRVTVLTNPASGHGNAPHAAETAVTRLQQRGIDVVAIVGSDAEHARRLLHAAVDQGTDALVVVGGDGVITDALQALAGTDIPLGIIPAGTKLSDAEVKTLKDKVLASGLSVPELVSTAWAPRMPMSRRAQAAPGSACTTTGRIPPASSSRRPTRMSGAARRATRTP